MPGPTICSGTSPCDLGHGPRLHLQSWTATLRQTQVFEGGGRQPACAHHTTSCSQLRASSPGHIRLHVHTLITVQPPYPAPMLRGQENRCTRAYQWTQLLVLHVSLWQCKHPMWQTRRCCSPTLLNQCVCPPELGLGGGPCFCGLPFDKPTAR
jgi:hypothetical protein